LVKKLFSCLGLEGCCLGLGLVYAVFVSWFKTVQSIIVIITFVYSVEWRNFDRYVA